MTAQTIPRTRTHQALHMNDINYYILDKLGPHKDMITYLNLTKSHKQLQTIPSVVEDIKNIKRLYKIYTQLQENLANCKIDGDDTGDEEDGYYDKINNRKHINRAQIQLLAKNILYAKKLFFWHLDYFVNDLEIKVEDDDKIYYVDCDKVDIILFLYTNLQYFPNLTYFEWLDNYGCFFEWGYMCHCTFPSTVKTIKTFVPFSEPGFDTSIRLLTELNLSFVLDYNCKIKYQQFIEFFKLDDDKVYDNIISIKLGKFGELPIMKYVDRYRDIEDSSDSEFEADEEISFKEIREIKSKILYKFPNLK